MATTTPHEPHSGYERLESQIGWYDRKSISAQRFYKYGKVTETLCAATIPLLAADHKTTVAILGIAITMFELLQHMNHWSENWITYRSTCESLRHEKYSYLGGSGVYEGKSPEEAKRILTGRVESLISTEHAKWISRQEYDSKRAANNKMPVS